MVMFFVCCGSRSASAGHIQQGARGVARFIGQQLKKFLRYFFGRELGHDGTNAARAESLENGKVHSASCN
jgi:hypothetical protein